MSGFQVLHMSACFFLVQMYFYLHPADPLFPNFHSSFLDAIWTVISGKDNCFTCSPDFQNLTQMAAITVMRAHRK